MASALSRAQLGHLPRVGEGVGKARTGGVLQRTAVDGVGPAQHGRRLLPGDGCVWVEGPPLQAGLILGHPAAVDHAQGVGPVHMPAHAVHKGGFQLGSVRVLGGPPGQRKIKIFHVIAVLGGQKLHGDGGEFAPGDVLLIGALQVLGDKAQGDGLVQAVLGPVGGGGVGGEGGAEAGEQGGGQQGGQCLFHVRYSFPAGWPRPSVRRFPTESVPRSPWPRRPFSWGTSGTHATCRATAPSGRGRRTGPAGPAGAGNRRTGSRSHPPG